MEESSNGSEKENKPKTPKRGFFKSCKIFIITFFSKKNNTIATALIVGLIILVIDKGCDHIFRPDNKDSIGSKLKDNHSNNVQNYYNGGITVNVGNNPKKIISASIKPLIHLRVITNYSELNSVISENLNAIIKNNTKDTVKLMFTYPPEAISDSGESAEYLPSKLTVYNSCGQIIIEKCHLPWVPEFRKDVVKNQVRRNIDSLVIGNIEYICKKLKECLK